jgi:transcriptional regulator with XRE-family HTH domain
VVERRKSRDWTQQQLADAAGVNVNTIKSVETGHWPQDQVKLRIASALDVDPYTLFPISEAVA